MPNSNGTPVPIKKVRLLQSTVTNPLEIKAQRDKSTKAPRPHKEKYYAANDGNYLMALYEGIDEKGNKVRDYKTINNYEISKNLRIASLTALKEQNINPYDNLVEPTITKKKTILSLMGILKTGTMVLLWQNTPEEVFDLISSEEYEELNKRLYKMVKFDKSGRLYFRHHKEARPASELKEVYAIDWENPCEQVRIPSGKLNALIEGIDFTLSPLGKIARL